MAKSTTNSGPIPVVDIFAGPGGLGEGFSSFPVSKRQKSFKIALSFECDPFAHQTLKLRALFRHLKKKRKLRNYYSYIRGEDGIDRAELFRRHSAEAGMAEEEAQCVELCEETREEVVETIKKKLGRAVKNGNWILLGGPPCQAYSLAGRSRLRPVIGDAFDDDHRHTLYEEYLAILNSMKPKLFVMENVKGILSSVHRSNNIFDLIQADLREEGYSLFPFVESKKHFVQLEQDFLFDSEIRYEPSDFIIRSEKFGIPQSRHRVIMLGIRKDLLMKKTDFDIPKLEELDQEVQVSEILIGLPKVRSGLSRSKDSGEAWKRAITSCKPTNWKTGLRRQEQTRFQNTIKSLLKKWSSPDDDRGGGFVPSDKIDVEYKHKWYLDPSLGGACNHEARSHMVSDLHRYLFASAYADTFGDSPTLQDLPKRLLPAHANISRATGSAIFNDRFRVQVWNKPATTITSHISKDGHYYIHPDPSQCRSLTVREAARIQTFPDNYFFEGPRTEQYRQVGNAVPPLLAYQIAEIVAEVFSDLA